ARRLVDRGFRPVLYNRSAGRATELAAEIGATVASTASAAVEAVGPAGVVLVSLADDDACRGVYLGEHGLLAGIAHGAVIADTSTISPPTVQELAAAAAERGAAMVDTPVSGSVPAALAGGLTVMAGGEAVALQAAWPVLS